MLKVIFIVCGILCFVLKAFGVSLKFNPNGPVVDFMNLGFAFMSASLLVWR